MAKEYVVVENAGYERECDVRRFPSYREACAFLERQYEAGEIESLHVEIAVEIDGVRTYEI